MRRGPWRDAIAGMVDTTYERALARRAQKELKALKALEKAVPALYKKEKRRVLLTESYARAKGLKVSDVTCKFAASRALACYSSQVLHAPEEEFIEESLRVKRPH